LALGPVQPSCAPSLFQRVTVPTCSVIIDREYRVGVSGSLCQGRCVRVGG
jgi:hypothetical protein